MKRRSFLTTLAAGTTMAVAGCTAGPSDDGDTGGTDPNDTNGTDGTSGAAVNLLNTDFQVVSQDCGQGANDSTVSYGESSVTVEGVVTGSDTCHTARLQDATYDAEADTLTVAVESYVPEENQGQACAQCIVDIQYTATADFEGGLPARTVVTHGGEQIASAEK